MSSLDKTLGSTRSLRKTKMSESTGWLRPTNKFTQKQTNELLTPRKLFRHKAVKKFIKNNRLTCLPAHRMINHEIKNIMRPTGGPIDMDNFNPKIFFQILAEWSENRFDQTFPKAWENKTFAEMHKLVHHRYDHPVHCRQRYYMFDPASVVSEPSEDKQKIDAFVQFLMNSVKLKGGIVDYINESGQWRIDAMGGVQKQFGWYKTWPDEPGGCPGRICNFCGVPNIYSRRDIKPSSKPNRSDAKHLPCSQTYDDKFLTEEMGWTTKDGVEYNEHPIAWRCRLCFADLSVKSLRSEFFGVIDLIEQVVMHYIGGLLDQLRLVRVTDFYDDANASDKASIIDHDMAIAKRLLIRLWHGTVVVPTNIDNQELKQLIKLAPQLNIVKSIKANSVAPSLVAELSVMTGYMRSVMGAKTQLIDGSLVKLRDKTQTTYTNFSDWLLPEINLGISHQSTKLHGPASLMKSAVELLNMANELNGIYVLTPTLKAIKNESSTVVKIHDDTAIWFVNSKPLGLIMNAQTWTMLDSDVIRVEYGYHYVVRIQAGSFLNLNFITRRMKLTPSEFNWNTSESTITITLPIPQLIDYQDGNLSIGVKCVTKSINRELFRALCIRNIQGKMEFKALCQYAIAFNMRRYTTGKVILKQEHIDYELIHFHVFACLYSMRLQNDRQWLSKLIMETVNLQNVKSLIASAFNKFSACLQLPEEASAVITFMDDASTMLATGAVPKSMVFLHSAMPSHKQRNLRMFTLSDNKLTNDVHRCVHHHSNCKHNFDPNGCKCCGAKCDDDICKCCAPSNYQDLLWGFTFDSAMVKLHIRLKLILKKIFAKQEIKPIKSTKALKDKDQVVKTVDPTVVNETVSNLSNLIEKILNPDAIPKNINREIDNLDIDIENEEDIEQLESVLNPMLVSMLSDERPEVYSTDTFEIILPFNQSNYIVLPNQKFEELERIDLPNTEVNSCGYEAYKYLTNSSYDLTEFRSFINSEPPFDEAQVFYVAESEKINLALYYTKSKNIQIVKNNSSDSYYTMGFMEPENADHIGHFYPGRIKFTVKPSYYLCEPSVTAHMRYSLLEKMNKLDWLTSFDATNAENLQTELTLKLTSMAATRGNVKDIEKLIIDGKTYITNHKTHNIQLSQFNFCMEIRPNLADIIVGTTSKLDDPEFKLHLTIPKDIPSDLTMLHSLCLVDEVAKMANTYNQIYTKDIKTCTFINQRRQIVGDLLQVNLGNGYVKPLDKLGIKHADGGVGIVTVRAAHGNTALVDNLNVEEKFVLIIPKNSTMSNLKRIVALQQASRDGTKLNMLLSAARSVNGYAGSGKTAEILEKLSNTSHALTATTISKQNLISRGYPAHKVKTLERATWDKPKCYHLYIDEANMMDYIDLSLALDPSVETLSLYYDSTQIGKFDSIWLQGEAEVQVITNYPLNTVKWAFSTRFGGELNKALKNILLDLEPNDNKNTTFDVVNLQKLDESEIYELVDVHRPDVILNPYTIESNIIRKWVKQCQNKYVMVGDNPINPFASILVIKSHSFQSKEAKRVMVVQWRHASGSMMLCRDKKYVVSACTRASEALILVSAGHKTPITGIHDAVSHVGGNLNTLYEYLEYDLDETARILNEVLIDDMVTATVHSNELWLYRSTMYVGKYFKNSDNVWVGNSHIPMVSRRLTEALHEPPGASVKYKVIDGYKRLLTDTSRVRALAWIVDLVVNSGKLYLGAEFRGYHVVKTTGCPYMAGLTMFQGMRVVLTISDGWVTPLTRSMSHVQDNHVVGQMVAWIMGEHSNSFLDNVSFDSRMETYMMIDRALTLPFAAIQTASMKNDQLSANTSQDNALWKNMILQKHRLPTTNRWRSSVRHNMLIYESVFSNKLTGTFYTMATFQFSRKFNVWSSADVWADVFNSALATVKPIMRRQRAIGAFGMYMTPEEHMEKQTTVGVFLKQQKISLDMRQKDSVLLQVNIASAFAEECSRQLMADKQMTDHVVHNALCITTPKHELVDSYALTKFGVQGQGTRVTYLGLNTHLNPVSNRHYISLMEPRGWSIEPFWLASLDVAKTWYAEYETRMGDTVFKTATELKGKLDRLTEEQRKQAELDLVKLQTQSSKVLNIVGTSSPNDVCVVGAISCHLTWQQIQTLSNNSNMLILSLPIEILTNTLNDCLMPETTKQPNESLMRALLTGYYNDGDVEYNLNVIDRLDEFLFVSLTRANRPICFNATTLQVQSPYVSLRIPVIQWANVSNTKPLVTTQRHKIDRRFMDRLLNYCIANDPTIDNLLAYVRSLLSTYDTSRTGIFPTYEASIEVACKSAIAAMTLYKVNYTGLVSLSTLAFANSELVSLLLNLESVMNKNNVTSDLFTGAIERTLQLFNFDVRKIASSVKELEVAMRVELPRIRYFTDHIDLQSEADVWNISPDTDDGDDTVSLDNDDESSTSSEESSDDDMMGPGLGPHDGDSSTQDNNVSEHTLEDDNESFHTAQTHANDDLAEFDKIKLVTSVSESENSIAIRKTLPMHDWATSVAIGYPTKRPTTIEIIETFDNMSKSKRNLLPNAANLVHKSSVNMHKVIDTTLVDNTILGKGKTANVVAKLASVHEPSNDFDAEEINHVSMKQLMYIADLPSSKIEELVYWMYWQPSNDIKQNEFIKDCWLHNREVVKPHKIIMLSSVNEHKYVHKTLLKIKPHVTIQCWSDIVRFWLLIHFGGVWMDASVVLDKNHIVPHKWLHHNEGMVFYQKLENNQYVLDNWFMVMNKNLTFMRLWYKCFLVVVKNGNNIRNALPLLDKMVNNAKNYMNLNEDYLTMHETSKLALKLSPLPNFIMLPGFMGPIGWIAAGLEMTDWMTRVLNAEYCMQGGLIKMIGMSREIVCKWQEATSRRFIDALATTNNRKEVLLIGCGTKGDVMSIRGLRQMYRAVGIEADCLQITNMLTLDDEFSIKLEIDPLELSDVKNITSATRALGFIKNLYCELVQVVTGKQYKYVVANLSVPCMIQVARLCGAVPINFTAMPVFESVCYSSSYVTMTDKYETLIKLVIDTLTRKVASDKNLPWVSDSVVNGIDSCISWRNSDPSLINNERRTINTYNIGNLVDCRNFSTPKDVIIKQLIPLGQKIDLIVLGPLINAALVSQMLDVTTSIEGKSSKVVVVSSMLNNLMKKDAVSCINRIRRLYNAVEVVDSINVYHLIHKVKFLFSHGGQNTVNDAHAIQAIPVCFGTRVDQPYWAKQTTKLRYVRPDSITDQIMRLHNIGRNYLEPLNCNQLMLNNGEESTGLTITKHVVQSTITFTPLVVENCVELCFRQRLKELHQPWFALADKMVTPLMEDDQVIELAFALGLNLAVIRDNTMLCYAWNQSKDWIHMQITNLGKLDHANLCNARIVSDLSLAQQPRSLYGHTVNASGLMIGQNALMTEQLQRFSSTGDISGLLLNEPLKSKLLHTMNSTKLDVRMARVSNPISFVTVHSVDKYVCKVESGKIPIGKLIAILTDVRWQYGIAVQDIDGATLITTDSQIDTNKIIVVDLGCKILDNILIKELRSVKSDAAPLNITTLNYLKTITTSEPYSNRMATLNTKTVLVHDYDNRGHDKYSERDIIGSCEVQWIGDQLTDVQQNLIKDTYGLPTRWLYSYGKLAWQFDDINYGQQWLLHSFATDCRLQIAIFRGVRLTGMFDDDQVADVKRFFAVPKPNPALVEGQLLTLSKKEWMGLMGIWGSGFDEVSSRTLVQVGEDFTAKVILTNVSVPPAGAWMDLTAQSYAYVTKTMLFSARMQCWFAKPRAGGDPFLNEEKISLGNSQDWWRKLGAESVILKDLEPNPLVDVMINAQTTITSNYWSNRANFASATDDICADEELNFDINDNTVDGTFYQVVPAEIQNLWINTDLSMDLRQYAPINSGNIRTKENPDKIQTTLKATVGSITPLESRPVLTKWTFEEHRSITGRLFSKIKYRRKEETKPTSKMTNDFIRTYFIDGFVPYTDTNQILDVDPYETMLWISKRKDGMRIAQELNELLTYELGLVPLNAINIHLKLESLMKEDPIMHWGQHQARAIYWQRKAIAAISSPVFLKIKTRLKDSLRAKFVYADGLTPGELNQKARNTTGVNWFFENDLSKQDRQTDKPLIDVEMRLYLALGASPSMISWWRTMHENWKFRARWNKGYAQEMRLTGQSTTALGNLITNMQVHQEFVNRNNSIIKLVLMLGDDILVMLSEKPDVKWIDRHTKRSHNMKSTQRLSDTSGLFCCMIAYKNANGGTEIGPDYVRLRYRFEVTNGVSESNDENILNRCQSYACMIGRTKEIMSIVRRKGWTIPLLEWYDAASLIPAIQERYDLDEYTVMNNYNVLCRNLENPIVNLVEFSTYTNVKVY